MKELSFSTDRASVKLETTHLRGTRLPVAQPAGSVPPAGTTISINVAPS